MIAAIYARKSTEQTGVADESKSVARQAEHARTYAERKGWTVADEHVYVDDGISGALFGASRPGLARLLNALSPRPPFQVLVMSEESRLGREAIETGYTLKQITDAGVAVWFYLEDRQRTLDSATDKVMMALSNFASEMEREKAGQRTHDALAQKARLGYVTGGRVFGYSNLPIMDGDRRARVERVIHEEEAPIVRRVFEMASSGMGYLKIAQALNVEGAPAPASRRPGQAASWSSSTVRNVLYCETYRGRLIWNRHRKDVRRGQRVTRKRPEGEWIARDAPELRIIDNTLWEAAHERLEASRAVYLPSLAGRAPAGRPVNWLQSPYLLSGFLSCGVCRGSMFARSYSSNRHRRVYVCVAAHTRGRAACTNGREVLIEAADAAVLGAVERDVLRVEVLQTVLHKAMEMLRPPKLATKGREHELREELARLDAEVGRLAGAIATGGDLPALLALLQERERRRGQARSELARLEHGNAAGARNGFDFGQVLDKLREKLTDWQGVLRQETGPARQALRALLAGRLVFMPQEQDGQRFYAFEGSGTISAVLAGVLPNGLGTPHRVQCRP